MDFVLPNAVAGYFAATNNGDRLVSFFTLTATAFDENNLYRGPDEIDAWKQAAREKFTYSVTPTGAQQLDDGSLLVATHVEGDFKGSPVSLDHRFRLEDGLIAELVIS